MEAETSASDPSSIILARYRVMLVEGKVPDAETIRGYMTALKEDGSWPDVNYKGVDRSDWEPFYHLFRTLDMAKAYARKGHPLHADKALLGKILLALDHWLTNRYRCPNGWYNTIAAPRYMGDIAALINDELTGDRRKAVIEIAGFQVKGRRRWGTGANLMDVAQTAVVKASLTGDTALLTEAARRVAGEVKVSAGEGIKDDWSFHQHGACAQLGYGAVYLGAGSRVGWLLHGTPYEIPKEKRAIVSQYILNGVQWMVRGPYQAPSVQDRQVSRPGCLGPSGGVRGQREPSGFWVGIAEKWMVVDPDNAAALKEFVARQNGKAAPLVGFKHFPRSDLSVYHRPGFSFFIRTRSPRVKGTESINRENLKGRPYLHTGDHYILMGTSEYTDMPPVWDWTRLPGLTMYEGVGRIQPQPFVGGVGDGTSGLTAMDYKRTLSVRKLWAYHGDFAVCLLGGWQGANGKKDLRTTLDQCALKEPVQINVDGKTTSLKPGTHRLRDVRWVLHNGVGYVPLSPSAMSLQLGEAEGSWRSIDAAQSDATVKENVFLCDLVHGESPVAGGFLLAPGSTAKTLDRLTKEPPCVVIRNGRDAQCIRFADGTFMAALYTPGDVALSGKPVLSVDKPCLALWSGKDLCLCDPTNPQQDVPVKVMWRGKTHSTTLPAGGKVLHLPQAERPAN
ncbi:polysaccharide lyase family 8 super-sandwich domain-containing protein [Planctomycetota bacterium]